MPDEIKVNIQAIDNTGPGIDSAKEGVDGLEQHMEGGLERVAERLAEYFAVEKIAEFVKESVTEFAKVEREMDILGAQVRANGEDWNVWKGQVDDFVHSEQAMYGFTRDQVLTSLTDAETKVKNVGAALKVTDEAQKLSLATGQSLATTTDALALAYEGNSRGMMELGRILGLDRDAAKDTTKVFDALGKATSNIGDVAGDTQGKLNTLASVWQNTQENLGKSLAPLIDLLSILEKVFASLIDEVFAFAKVIVDWTLTIPKLILGMMHPIEAIKGAFGDLKKDVTDLFGQLGDIWGDSVKKVDVISDQAFAKEAERNSKRVADAKATAEEQKKASEDALKLAESNRKELSAEQDTYDKYMHHRQEEIKTTEQMAAEDHAKYLSLVGKTDADSIKARLTAYQDYIKDVEKLESKAAQDLKKQQQEIKKLGEEMAKSIESSMATSIKAVLKGTETMTQAFQELGKSIVKSIIGALAKVLEEKAAWYIAQGIAEMISSYGAEGETDLIAGAGLAAAAGTLQGAADAYLAEGGVVMGPTHVMAGEGGEPEAVVPLSKLPDLINSIPRSSGSSGPTIIHVHGVQNAAQFVNQLPGHLTRAQTRQGYRLSTTS